MEYMDERLRRLQDCMLCEIPMAQAMGVSVADFDGQWLTLTAPLANNTNDKGTAFAGSLAAIATLAGWALTHWVVEDMGMTPDGVASSTRIEYLKPVREDIVAVSVMPDEAVREKLQRMLTRKRIGRWTVNVTISSDGEPAVEFSGTYVVTV
jgi:thioesterase domain-containing protein